MLRNFILSLVTCLLAVAAQGQQSRHFTFRYSFTIRNVPSGERIRVWFPLAHSDDFQEVKVTNSNGDLRLKKTRGPKYGNEMFFAEGKAKQSDLHFEVTYDVIRHERLTLGRAIPHLEDVKLDSRESKEFLAADALVPVTGKPAELAAEATKGQTTDLAKARAIYDYVFSTMKYYKSGT